ncbi:MAG TPA: PorP/SprF family type IX secretion system membrane protein [Bacteroidales bacterium]|nr:PorP/SprF family type IX secretion system membrane protein [Bacteroidales bacterium]
MRKILFILFFSLVAAEVLGQDVHFSQYTAAPLELNPANAGLIKGRFRVGLNSKRQWSSVTKPYQNIAAYFDMQALRRKYRKDALGIGVLLNADIAGDSKYSTINTGFAITYIKSLSYQNNNFISIGVMPGIVQQSIDYTALYYDNQYNGSYYDPAIDPGEQYGRKSFVNFDLAAGVHWFYQYNKTSLLSAGYSLSHITRPKVGYMNDDDIRLNMKHTVYGGGRFAVSPDVEILPSAMFSYQEPYMEILFGAMLKYNRSKNYSDNTSLNFGLFGRYADALIVVAGLDYKNINFGVSYDVNLSRLRPASQVRGGLEFSISYTYDKNKYRRIREIPCPIF